MRCATGLQWSWSALDDGGLALDISRTSGSGTSGRARGSIFCKSHTALLHAHDPDTVRLVDKQYFQVSGESPAPTTAHAKPRQRVRRKCRRALLCCVLCVGDLDGRGSLTC
jgi:hypothetical protein